MPIHAKLFTCEKCNFSCSKHSNWDKHTMTAKHINRTNRTPKNAEKYRCDCGKEYKARNSFWYHKQKCKVVVQEQTQVPPPVDSSLVIELLKQNQEFRKNKWFN